MLTFRALMVWLCVALMVFTKNIHDQVKVVGFYHPFHVYNGQTFFDWCHSSGLNDIQLFFLDLFPYSDGHVQ